jgi:hypothetical protein
VLLAAAIAGKIYRKILYAIDIAKHRSRFAFPPCARLLGASEVLPASTPLDTLRQMGETQIEVHECSETRNPPIGTDEAREWPSRVDLMRCSRIRLLLTGGTSLMQWIVAELVHLNTPSPARVGIPVETYIAVDERSPEEQDKNPWVVGRLIRVERLPSAREEWDS